MGLINAPSSNPNVHWPSPMPFTADTTLMEKVSRVVNGVVFVGAAGGIYALAMLSVTPLAIAGYICMALATRKIIAVAIGYIAYPVTKLSQSERISLQDKENIQIENLKRRNFIVQKRTLYKSGIEYEALLVGDPQKTKKWTLQALGNMMAVEDNIENFACENYSKGSSCTMFVKPSSEGLRGAYPTRFQLGAGLEAGMQLLEKQFNPTHILLDGFSIGGGTLSEAILNHDFKTGKENGIQYLAISRVTFDSLANMAGKITCIAKLLCFLCGMDLDGVAAARKLSKEGIEQIVIQHKSPYEGDSDGVIPDDASLAQALHEEGLNKTFLESSSISHSYQYPQDIKDTLQQKISEFFENSISTTKIDLIKRDHQQQLAQFEDWAQHKDWKMFTHAHYDWWMFPIQRKSSRGTTYSVSDADIEILKNDADFMSKYRRGVELVLNSWGWDPIQNLEIPPGQKTAAQRWEGYDVRLGKMADSLYLFGEKELYKSVQKFAQTCCYRPGVKPLDIWVIQNLSRDLPN